jgi:hypothetical protein
MQELFGNLWNLQWQQVVMWGIGGLLIWLAIKKEMEPSLLLPMGFGAILVNLPLSGAVTQVLSTGTEVGPLDVLFDAGIANELFPLLLFVGIGAMIDFTPLPLLRFAVSATGGAHLCSIQYYLRFWLSICRTSLAVSALRIMRYCLYFFRFVKCSSSSTAATMIIVTAKTPSQPRPALGSTCINSVKFILFSPFV